MTNSGSSKPDGEAEATDESCGRVRPRSLMRRRDGRLSFVPRWDGLAGRNVEDKR